MNKDALNYIGILITTKKGYVPELRTWVSLQLCNNADQALGESDVGTCGGVDFFGFSLFPVNLD